MTIASTRWPWYVAGPAIGLFVPALLIAGEPNVWRFQQPESFLFRRPSRAGSSIFVAIGSALASGISGSRPASWWEASLVQPGGGPHHIAISEQTRLSIMRLGIHDLSGLARSLHYTRGDIVISTTAE